uniref:Probable serine/threonine-protein kinase DDB_G0283065 n=1 Tax=Dermatophagoides pteronyssinus TaxID=6956 RepID=A0A6P6Y7K3_DERPT|nr:probable serine/threonine-protein kinase DDB_G0283065 [Dermatophagoides pteronyssinus]
MMQKTTTRNSKIQTKRFQNSSTTNLSVKKISNQKSTPAIIIKGKKNVSTTKLAIRKTNLEMKKFSAKINNSSRSNKLNKNVNIKNFRPIKRRLITTTTTKHSVKHDLKLIKYKFVENSFVVNNNDDNDDDFDFDDNDFLRSTLDSSSSSSSSWSIGTNETTTETKSKTLSIILSLNNHNNNNNPLTTKRWSSKEINYSSGGSSSIIEVFGYLNLEQFCAELEGLTNL